jgi:uncharacterized membrane protein
VADVHAERSPVERGRADAFTDGVFAIALTLLVLELHVPRGHGDLLRALAHEWPSYVAFALSFARIANVWIFSHMHMVRFERIRVSYLWVVVALLGLVTLLPFSTALLAAHLDGWTGSGRVAAVWYGVHSTLIALWFAAMVRYILRHVDDLTTEQRAIVLSSKPKPWRPVALYAATLPFAAIGALPFVVVHAGVVLYASLPPDMRRRRSI